MDTPHIPGLPQPARLYSSRQIGLASVLGSPLAGGWLFSRNYLALGDEPRARRSLWLGVVATIVLLASAFFLPDKFPNAIVPAAYGFAIERYASRSFGAAYDKHIAAGGAKGSWWAAIGVGFASFLVVLGLLIVGLPLMWRVTHGT
jgi:hypothetical protein